MKRLIASSLLTILCAGSCLANENATPAEAEERLKAIVGLVKAKGAAAGKDVMAADDPVKCKYKDMVCMLMDTADGTFLAQTALAKLVGTKFDPEMADVDGVPIVEQWIGPAKQGKTQWQAKWKFARPDTKKVSPRLATCAKADATRVACVSVAQP